MQQSNIRIRQVYLCLALNRRQRVRFRWPSLIQRIKLFNNNQYEVKSLVYNLHIVVFLPVDVTGWCFDISLPFTRQIVKLHLTQCLLSNGILDVNQVPSVQSWHVYICCNIQMILTCKCYRLMFRYLTAVYPANCKLAFEMVVFWHVVFWMWNIFHPLTFKCHIINAMGFGNSHYTVFFCWNKKQE